MKWHSLWPAGPIYQAKVAANIDKLMRWSGSHLLGHGVHGGSGQHLLCLASCILTGRAPTSWLEILRGSVKPSLRYADEVTIVLGSERARKLPTLISRCTCASGSDRVARFCTVCSFRWIIITEYYFLVLFSILIWRSSSFVAGQIRTAGGASLPCLG
jgi:hypothetical protein